MLREDLTDAIVGVTATGPAACYPSKRLTRITWRQPRILIRHTYSSPESCINHSKTWWWLILTTVRIRRLVNPG